MIRSNQRVVVNSRKRHYDQLPPSLGKSLPESQLYTKLQKLEQRIDAGIARKHLEITAALRQPERQRLLLRVFIHNTHSNQPVATATAASTTGSASTAMALASTGGATTAAATGTASDGRGGAAAPLARRIAPPGHHQPGGGGSEAYGSGGESTGSGSSGSGMSESAAAATAASKKKSKSVARGKKGATKGGRPEENSDSEEAGAWSDLDGDGETGDERRAADGMDFGLNWDEEDAMLDDSGGGQSRGAAKRTQSPSPETSGLELQLTLPSAAAAAAAPEDSMAHAVPQVEKWSPEAQELQQRQQLEARRMSSGASASSNKDEDPEFDGFSHGDVPQSAGLADPPSWSMKIQLQVLTAGGRLLRDHKLVGSDFVQALFVHLDPETFEYSSSPYVPALSVAGDHSGTADPQTAAHGLHRDHRYGEGDALGADGDDDDGDVAMDGDGDVDPEERAPPEPATARWLRNAEGDQGFSPVSDPSVNGRLPVAAEPAAAADTVIEWRQGLSRAAVDGFEVSRVGDRGCRARIELHLQHSPDVYQLSPGLESLLKLHTGTLNEVLRAFWGYVRENQLLTPLPKRYVVHADDHYRSTGAGNVPAPSVSAAVLDATPPEQDAAEAAAAQQSASAEDDPHGLPPNGLVVRLSEAMRQVFGAAVFRLRPYVEVSPLATSVADAPLYLPMFCIPGLLRSQLDAPPPFVCDYVVRLSGDPQRHADVYDLMVTAPELYFVEDSWVIANQQQQQQQAQLAASNPVHPTALLSQNVGLGSLSGMVTGSAAAAPAVALRRPPPTLDSLDHSVIRRMNRRLEQLLAEIREVDARREFLQAFSESPVDMINLLLSAQSVDLRLLEQHMTSEALRMQAQIPSSGVEAASVVGSASPSSSSSPPPPPPHPILLSYASSVLLAQHHLAASTGDQLQEQLPSSGYRLTLGSHSATDTFRQDWVAEAVDRYLLATGDTSHGAGDLIWGP